MEKIKEKKKKIRAKRKEDKQSLDSKMLSFVGCCFLSTLHVIRWKWQTER